MRTIKLMADYNCFPLWEATPGLVGNIDPDSLPLSLSLRQSLMTWAEAYDNTLNLDDPMTSGFSSPAIEEEFKKTGHQLAVQLRSELGTGFTIIEQI